MRAKILCFLTIFTITWYTNNHAHTLQTMNYHTYPSPDTIPLPHDKKIVLVGGCFDILHFGHIQFLQKARECGDYVVVVLEPDERITQHKKRTPTHTQMERAYNLLALHSVNHVILLPLLHGFDDYLKLVKAINPQVIAITAGDPQLTNKQKHADSIGAELIEVTTIIGNFSSSAIYQQHKN
jgi:cytidyltransferase-like protein